MTIPSYFTTTNDIKYYVGNKVDINTPFLSLQSFVKAAENRFIINKFFPITFWQDIEGSISEPENAYIFDKYKGALAWFALYLNSEIEVSQNDGSVYRTETDTVKSPYKYQTYEARMAYLRNAYDYLDAMLEYMYRSGGYTSWGLYHQSLQCKNLHKSWILFASNFSQYSSRQLDVYTFRSIYPTLVATQQSLFASFLPKAFVADIETKWFFLYGECTEAEIEFVNLVLSAVASIGLEVAAKQNIIQFSGNQVFLSEKKDNDAGSQMTYNADAFSQFSMSQIVKKNDYLSRAKKYAIDNKDDFPLLFNEASGGTNTAADAWHIPTAAEQTTAAESSVTSKIYVF